MQKDDIDFLNDLEYELDCKFPAIQYHSRIGAQ